MYIHMYMCMYRYRQMYTHMCMCIYIYVDVYIDVYHVWCSCMQQCLAGTWCSGKTHMCKYIFICGCISGSVHASVYRDDKVEVYMCLYMERHIYLVLHVQLLVLVCMCTFLRQCMCIHAVYSGYNIH